MKALPMEWPFFKAPLASSWVTEAWFRQVTLAQTMGTNDNSALAAI